MRRIDRLIIQILRAQRQSITAQEIADQLEVSVRTVYRDIQALQAMRTPIDGEAGVGYMLRQSYDLPPINFSADEIDAIVVGLNLLARTGDKGLQKAAKSVAYKIETVHGKLDQLQSSAWGVEIPAGVDPEVLRRAIREERKLDLNYRDAGGTASKRRLQPIAIVYFIEVIVLVAWCELRKDFRNFRLDRIERCQPLEIFFRGKGDKLRARWNNEA